MNEVRPTAREIRENLAKALSTRSRVFYTLVLLFDLAAAIVVGSLWLTEPSLPQRTQIAFGLMLAAALTWSGFLLWTLTRRTVMLAFHRLIAGRIAVLFCSLFTLGFLALGLTQANLRAAGFSAAGMGGLLLLLASALLLTAQRRYRELITRRHQLEQQLGR